MKVTDLPKHVTLYELAKVLGITAPAAYKYKIKTRYLTCVSIS